MKRGEGRELAAAVAALEAHYGDLPPLEADPWKAVVWENVAYLVDDERRRATYDALRKKVGLAPEDILRASRAKLVDVIAGGGMQPQHRAEKLQRAAEVATEIGVVALVATMKRDARAGRRLLKRFPGIGDPGADRMLMARGAARTLAPDSNALRVLIRLGWGKDDPSYTRAYKSVAAATEPHLPDDAAWLARAHVVLRHHGKSLCVRGLPACGECPLRADCPSSNAPSGRAGRSSRKVRA